MRLIVVGFIFLLIAACQTSSSGELRDHELTVRIPKGFKPINYPEGNEPTELRVLLGRHLFYDNRLSIDNTVNCGTCHVLSAAFTDGRKTSEGILKRIGKRNAPTLANVAWSPRFMMEGGVPTLEAQALAPLHDTMEMGGDMMVAVAKLNRDEELRRLARAAYGRDSIDPFVITRSLAAFQRTFISADSPYDRYINGKKDELTEAQVRGMDLFNSTKTMCFSCHSGNNFTDYAFYNIGLYEEYADEGRQRLTGEDRDNSRFKTPTLRNIELTTPYMHDGSVSSLEEVITLYNAGGKRHRNKDARITPLHLTEQEQADLLAFMKALTDYNFVQNKALLPLK